MMQLCVFDINNCFSTPQNYTYNMNIDVFKLAALSIYNRSTLPLVGQISESFDMPPVMAVIASHRLLRPSYRLGGDHLSCISIELEVSRGHLRRPVSEPWSRFGNRVFDVDGLVQCTSVVLSRFVYHYCRQRADLAFAVDIVFISDLGECAKKVLLYYLINIIVTG